MSDTPMNDAEVNKRLADLPGWELREGKLARDFQFADFKAAFAFMTHVALWAEQMNHHPEWFNVYNRVSVQLTTHDAKGITGKDFDLATAMQTFAALLND